MESSSKSRENRNKENNKSPTHSQMHLFKVISLRTVYEPVNTRMLRGLLRNVFKTIFSDVQADSWPGRGHDLRLATSDLHHAICKNELNVPIVHVFTCRKVDTFLFFSRKKCYCCSSKFSWDRGGTQRKSG